MSNDRTDEERHAAWRAEEDRKAWRAYAIAALQSLVARVPHGMPLTSGVWDGAAATADALLERERITHAYREDKS